MKNLNFDNEEKIIEYFQDSDDKILGFPESNEVLDIYMSIHDQSNWGKWSNNAVNTNTPPDFISREFGYIMEIMRIDDHAEKNGKVNKTLAKEKEISKELRDSEILKSFPNVSHILINADSGEETEKDHNYDRYLQNFKRIVSKHAKQARIYRENFPNKKLIFFVFDEVSGIYFEAVTNNPKRIGSMHSGKPHWHFLDNEFVNIIKDSNSDFLIWYKPYSQSFIPELEENGGMPKIIIYDIERMNIETIQYDLKKMISNEIWSLTKNKQILLLHLNKTLICGKIRYMSIKT